MLDESASGQEAAREDKAPDNEKVPCFVCKREVERSQCKQIHHPKHKQVWVCEIHIK